ncbi:MAG: helix-turn-helix domain-containing protein, partial [Lachnospiraceae bacterium]|jgi:transcriptional regulator GlxA family with amidase domain
LPTASFRFRLTADTLAVQLCTSSLPRRTRDFHPLERAHGAHTKKTAARMSAAVILLQSTELSVADISEQIGFSSAEHFSNTFRKFSGMSPRQFRKKIT